MTVDEGQPESWIEDADGGSHFGRILRPWDIAKMATHRMSDDSEMCKIVILSLDLSRWTSR